MKTFGKSFLGAATGTLLILFVAMLVMKYTSKDDSQAGNFKSSVSAVSEYESLPVHQASYSIPQNVDFTTAAEKTVNAVVHIKTEIRVKSASYDDFFGTFRDYFGNPYRDNVYVAYGSGVIISEDGYIVTNNHVVEGAEKVTVTFNNKKEKEATIVGLDPSSDLALIKVDADDLTYLNYGNSDDTKIGEWVLAVGNPFNLNSTVTAGIVSAKARNINILGSGSAVESFIQTDAAVNRGNSGGALVNTAGELIGINAAIASHTGVYEGYSFAIPSNIVHKVVNDLMKYGEIQRAYLGVQISNINAEFADKLGLEEIKGVYVAGVVEGGGAYEAGVREGDIIAMINGSEVNSLSELIGSIAQHNPGEYVTVNINRDNDEFVYKVQLKNQNNNTALVKSTEAFYNEVLGVSLKKLTSKQMKELGLRNGLWVSDMKDGILRRGGISEGFIITEINGQQVDSENSLTQALAYSQQHKVSLRGIYPDGTRVSYEFML